MQGCADLFDVASHTSLKGSEFLSFMLTMFFFFFVLFLFCQLSVLNCKVFLGGMRVGWEWWGEYNHCVARVTPNTILQYQPAKLANRFCNKRAQIVYLNVVISNHLAFQYLSWCKLTGVVISLLTPPPPQKETILGNGAAVTSMIESRSLDG